MLKSVYPICEEFLWLLPKPLYYTLLHNVSQHEHHLRAFFDCPNVRQLYGGNSGHIQLYGIMVLQWVNMDLCSWSWYTVFAAFYSNGTNWLCHYVIEAQKLGQRPKISLNFPLGKSATVFQTEIYAILQFAYKNIRRAYKNKQILIFSDSQAALKALSGPKVTSELVAECWDALTELATQNRVTLVWVPGCVCVRVRVRMCARARACVCVCVCVCERARAPMSWLTQTCSCAVYMATVQITTGFSCSTCLTQI
jgi:hypothetical protein